MTNVRLVVRKLGVLDEHVTRLRARRPAEVAAFKADLLLQDAIAMGVLVCVQEAMDIALHLASDNEWELATTYREAFDVLARHGVIDGTLATAMADAASVRNRIAHGYATMDAERLWSDLPVGIAAFQDFSSAIARYVRSP
jgi:uncharacterized protein YutE (UPF0331/DUF86 family)